ncbi:MAG TPA: hypothetical protein VFR37_24150 [Longimicrobium sp.]|nr:hypothetical protein [Longimicrobium sp.]
MTRHHMDPNDLARFLDRSMSEDEHGRAVAHLSASDEDAEVLADAAYLLRELEAADPVVADATASEPVKEDDRNTGTDAKVVPFRPPSTRAPRRVSRQWLALAAVLAGVLLVPFALSRRGGDLGSPGDYAALLSNREAGVSAEWLEDRPWSTSTTRGGPGDSATDNARAVELGVLHVDLEVAVAARQADQMQLLGERLRILLEDVSGSGGAVQLYREIGRDPDRPVAQQAELLRQAEETVAVFLQDDVHYALGAWAEAARLAARSRDTAFFAARPSQEALDRFSKAGELAPPAREAAQQVRAQLEAGGAPDWTLLMQKLGTLLVTAHQPVIE